MIQMKLVIDSFLAIDKLSEETCKQVSVIINEIVYETLKIQIYFINSRKSMTNLF